jgi:FlaA1/EpsC-like NDP-sugar epimerase
MRSLAELLRRGRSKLRLAVPRPKRARADVPLADLLRRPVINLDTPELQRFLAGKRVMVTGAGGSIGSEICRQAMRFCPQRLLLVERAENALFEIDRELRHTWVGADVRPLIADVCDAHRVRQVFEAERPQVVFHCAAHKHVPMMERNAAEAIKNNVFGTKTVADAALAAKVQAFVLVSTDKAVNPTSVMGATKRVAELYVQSLNGQGSRVKGQGSAPLNSQSGICNPQSPTRFLAVRFGNVLGSSGSVVPIFQKQIEAGGPVTVTHPDMRRYFMTIPEASQLVMQAGAIGRGGEIFVLDMGEQVRILDLARELIRRNGLEPGEDIELRFTGIRPGEKLYEELACDDEQTRPTSHAKIRVWELPPARRDDVERGLKLLMSATTGNNAEAVAALHECVPEYATGEAVEARPALRLVKDEAAESAAA